MSHFWKILNCRLVEMKCLIMGGAIALSIYTPAIAQQAQQSVITPDTDWGNENSEVTRNFNGQNIDLITRGAERGTNVFHSLSEFKVIQERSAFFIVPNAGTQNVLVRITGNNPAEIFGTLGVRQRIGTSLPSANANLFLMSPQGIIFGPSSRLSLNGSFVATTANAIQFGNLGSFNVTDKTPPSPLLTINPSALIFNQQARQIPSAITATSQLLAVRRGQNLLLVGGNVDLQNTQLLARSGRIEIAAVTDGIIGIETDNLNRPQLNVPNNFSGATVSIGGTEGALDVRGRGDLDGFRDGGTIQIYADSIKTNDAEATAKFDARGEGGKGGSIELNAQNDISLSNANIYVGSNSIFDAGRIALQARNQVLLTGKETLLAGETSGEGKGADVQISSQSIRLDNGASIKTTTSGSGQAGNVTLEELFDDQFSSVQILNRSEISSTSQKDLSGQRDVTGKAGSINIRADAVTLAQGSQLATSTSSSGDAGIIDINTGDQGTVAIFNSLIRSDTVNESTGQGGEIRIQTGDFSLVDGVIITATSGSGAAGNIQITATNSARSVAISREFEAQLKSFNFSTPGFRILAPGIYAGTIASGNAGSINVATKVLQVQGGARISASTTEASSGRGGALKVNASTSVELSGKGATASNPLPGGLFSETNGSGPAGNITVKTPSLVIQDGAQISATTSQTGKAGDITAEVGDRITLSGDGTQISASTSGRGDAGNVNLLNTQNLAVSVSDGAQISASTSAQGAGGSVTVNTQDLSVNNGAQISATTSGEGAGGSVTVTTNTLEATSGGKLITDASQAGKAGDITANVRDRITLSGDGTQISASTSGSGDAGNLVLNTRDISVSDRAQISAETSGEGAGGSIVVKARSFAANTGGRLQTTTSGSGNAGNITATIEDKIRLAGTESGMLANTAPGSLGNGGSININTQTATIQDGASIAVGSQGRGQGGDVQIQAENLTLDNQGRISAETNSGRGGDVRLQVGKLLLLQQGSQISTTAGKNQGGGDGGNIWINALFVAATPQGNSDITANAFTGRGGRVDITTRGIFGIAPAARLTPLSDITASSEFGISGVVTINTPDVDPARGLEELPGTPIDPSNQIRQTCRPAGTQQANSFVVTGRGGIPISPERTIQQTPLTGWVTVDKGNSEQHVSTNSRQASQLPTPNSQIPNSPIVEAQGWIKDAQGNVWLVSDMPATSVNPTWAAKPVCP